MLTLAYYPDGRQEKLFHQYGIDGYVNYMHAMAYDMSGPSHSPFSMSADVAQNAVRGAFS